MSAQEIHCNSEMILPTKCYLMFPWGLFSDVENTQYSKYKYVSF